MKSMFNWYRENWGWVSRVFLNVLFNFSGLVLGLYFFYFMIICIDFILISLSLQPIVGYGFRSNDYLIIGVSLLVYSYGLYLVKVKKKDYTVYGVNV